MRKFHFIIFLFLTQISCLGNPSSEATSDKAIHVFVALCDNEFQGIVPVPKSLGNGQEPNNNLYWGAMYGVKSFLRYKCANWEMVSSTNPKETYILERVVFYNKNQDKYLVADAYDGQFIKQCTKDFIQASNGQNGINITVGDKEISAGGHSELVAYCGHDGLMDFSLDMSFEKPSEEKDFIILACISKEYYADLMKKSGANPLVWTTGLMAPEAYTLIAAIDSWILNEEDAVVREKAAAAYHKYQKCGMNGARNLLVTGW